MGKLIGQKPPLKLQEVSPHISPGSGVLGQAGKVGWMIALRTTCESGSYTELFTGSFIVDISFCLNDLFLENRVRHVRNAASVVYQID